MDRQPSMAAARAVSPLGDQHLVPGPDLIGREAELRVVGGLVDGLVAGQGASVWVEGEPGIGKTSLLSALLARAGAAGCQIYAASADESSALFPLQVLLDALQIDPTRIDPTRHDIAGRLWGGQDSDQVRLGDPVAAAAEMILILVERLCATGPVVLAVDDLQWAADASLAVWSRLHRATSQLPLLLVAAARPVPRRESVDQLRRQLTESGAVELMLPPLGDAAVRDLVERLATGRPVDELMKLVDRAGGNPLYIGEVVDALRRELRLRLVDGRAELPDAGASVPTTLAAAISARLSFLSEDVNRTLRMAAVLGAQFRLDHLSLLTGQPVASLTPAVDEAMRAAVLGVVGGFMAFRHGLIHQSLYDSLPVPLRQALHRQAAQSLAEAGESPEAVARHVLAADDTIGEWAVAWLDRAATSLSQRAPDIAVTLLERVRQEVVAGDPRRVRLNAHLVDAYAQLSRWESVDRLVVPVLADTRDPEIIGRMSWHQSYGLQARGRMEEAAEVCSETLTRRSLTPRWTARLRSLHASNLLTARDFERCLDAATQALAEAEQVGDRIAQGWALKSRGLALGIFRNDAEAALSALERAEAVVGEDPSAAELRLMILSAIMSALDILGRTAEAADRMGRAVALAEQAGTPHLLASLRVQAAETWFLAGRWDDSLPELEMAVAALSPTSPLRIMLRGVGALIAVHRGDEELIARYLLPKIEIVSGAEPMSDDLLFARALYVLGGGDAAGALRQLVELFDPTGDQSFAPLSASKACWIPVAVRLALELDARPVAQAAAAACSAEAKREPTPAKVAAAAHCEALVADDPAGLLAAAAAFARNGYPVMHASALEDGASALARSGDLAAARIALDNVLNVYTQLGAEWDIRRALARLRVDGVRVGARGLRRRGAVGFEALTPAELRVATLIAAGKSNPDIAAELFLSRSTVQTHVSHILAKLGCHSRTEIAARVRAATG